ncbi:MAG: hypothetical protein WDM80_06040 [Limisphaerales bacterium]
MKWENSSGEKFHEADSAKAAAKFKLIQMLLCHIPTGGLFSAGILPFQVAN